MIEGKNILVTGGAGFIGSNLCRRLLALNNRIVCLDNFSTGKRENIQAFLHDTRFQLIEGDIRSLDTCRCAVKGVDYVLHEAALGSVPRSIEDPVTTNEVNICGFLNMLIASHEGGVKRFVYAASSSTYGDSVYLPKKEDIIGKPLSPYAITKYVNELYADVFSRLYGMDVIGLRYFNVFGPHQDPNGPYAAVIPLFIRQLINHESPLINGDGEFSRDFTYIDNIIRINLLALETTNPDVINQVYNAACGEQTTLNQLADYLKEFLSEYDPEIRSIKIMHGPTRKGDIPHSLASVEKAKQLLKYKPTHTVSEGLKETVKWFYNEIHK